MLVVLNLSFSSLCLSLSAEGRRGGRPSDYHSGTRAGDRLHQTLHVSGNLYHDQETHQVQTGRLLLPRPAGLRDLDVHRLCLHRSERGALPGESERSGRQTGTIGEKFKK